MTFRRGFTGIALSVALAGATLAAPAQLANAAGTRSDGHERVTTFQHLGQHGRHRGRDNRQHRRHHNRHHLNTVVTQENLVSDQAGVATLTDPNLINPWGISAGPTTPIWVSNNGTSTSTLYAGDTGGTAVSQPALTVSVPGGPTGQVFNSTTAFAVPGTGMPASFLFDGVNGVLTAWNQAAGTTAVPVATSTGAEFTGMALTDGPAGPQLLAADFHNNRIDVFDGQFNPVPEHGRFTDPFLPRDYAPFNVTELNGLVYVTYALQDANAVFDVAGPGHGFVDVYTDSGRFVRRLASHGPLNSPWGVTIAPSSFGRLAGDVLVGNFGDGRIHVFAPRSGRELGTLRDSSGQPLTIDGLWALVVGNSAAGGTDGIWFSAGPDGGQHGLVGVLRPHLG